VTHRRALNRQHQRFTQEPDYSSNIRVGDSMVILETIPPKMAKRLDIFLSSGGAADHIKN
jgi:hypothetical protein